MWQYIIIGIVLVAASAFVIVRIVRTLTGRGGCSACAKKGDCSMKGQPTSDAGCPGSKER